MPTLTPLHRSPPKGVQALQEAKHYLGVHEVPPGSNRGPHIDDWLRAAGVAPGNPWCMAYVRAMFALVGVQLGGGASVGLFEQWGRSHGRIIRPGGFKPGDVICYEFTGDHWPDHVGICDHVALRDSRIVHWDHSVEPVRRGDVIAIEGNTAIGNDSDGGRVMFRARHPELCLGVRIS